MKDPQIEDSYMEIAKLKIEENEFDLFLNLRPKDKIEFLHDAGSLGMDLALAKVFEMQEPIVHDQQPHTKESKKIIRDLFHDTSYEEMIWGNDRLNVLIINKSIHINSNSLKWIKRIVRKLWMDGHILIKNKIAKKIPGIDKFRYYRCYDIIGSGPPICLS